MIKNEMQKIIQRRVIIMLVLILLLAGCMAALFYYTAHYEKIGGILVDTLGRQQMLSQVTAKEASRIRIITTALASDANYESNKTLKKKLLDVKSNLRTSRYEFARNLQEINNGQIERLDITVNFSSKLHLIKPQIENLNQIWGPYSDAIEVMLDDSPTNAEMAQAIIYINSKNEEILSLCDRITRIMVEDNQRSSDIRKITFSVLMFVILGLISFSVYSFFKYIALPLQAIYQTFFGIGLLKNDDNNIPSSKELMPVIDEIRESYRKQQSLIGLIQNINTSISFTDVLDYIYEDFSEFIPFSYIGIALLKNDDHFLEASFGISEKKIPGLPENLTGKQYELSETSLKKIFADRNPRIIADLEEYASIYGKREYTEIILDAGIKSSITLPLYSGSRSVGMIFFSSLEKNIYTEEHAEFLRALADSIAISLDRNIFLDDLMFSSVLALAKLAEARDNETGDHLDRMKAYSYKIAQLLANEEIYSNVLTKNYMTDIARFSPLHDIGKVGIRDSILLKPGKLTYDEFEEMKGHTLYGARVMEAAEENIKHSGRSLFSMGIEIAGGHHEKWDGSGYPLGLKGDDIPLSARIVAVADVFDALTSRRPYKEPFPFDESFRMVVNLSGTHFDPSIIKVFQEKKAEIFNLYDEFRQANPGFAVSREDNLI